jgi:hypothetical protein
MFQKFRKQQPAEAIRQVNEKNLQGLLAGLFKNQIPPLNIAVPKNISGN